METYQIVLLSVIGVIAYYLVGILCLGTNIFWLKDLCCWLEKKSGILFSEKKEDILEGYKEYEKKKEWFVTIAAWWCMIVALFISLIFLLFKIFFLKTFRWATRNW